ncbi:MAG TPA: helix-turn-helix transcriptional regulator, partial [Microvirga sp.]|nr:helix-turn-helix transcriptional regulator [Microvirga sp.]
RTFTNAATTMLAMAKNPRIGRTTKQLHAYLREWRLYKDLTQEQVAARMETTAANISRKENARRAPKPEFLHGFAAALELEDPADLFHPPEVADAASILRSMAPEERERAVEILKAFRGRAA